jgi:hypothetical protein
MPFIMCPEKNGSNPLAIAGSGLTGDPVLRPKQPDPGRSPARTAGMEAIRLFPGQNGQDWRDAAKTAWMDMIRPFSEQNGQIPPGWPESGPSPTRSVVGVMVQSETIWIFGRLGSELCGWRAEFPAVWWFLWKWVEQEK